MTQPTRQQLLDDITLPHDGGRFPFTNLGWGMAKMARCNVNQTVDPIVPGQWKPWRKLATAVNGRQYINGTMLWAELSSWVRTKIKANVEVVDAWTWILLASGVWLKVTAWSGRSFVGHPFDWTNEWAQYAPLTAPDGHRMFGFDSVGGKPFMAQTTDRGGYPTTADGAVRVHMWDDSWTETDNDDTPHDVFWCSKNPGIDTSTGDRVLLDTVVALAWGIEVRVVGPDAAKSQFFMQTGLDMMYEGEPTTGLVAGEREGIGGRGRNLPTDGSSIVVTGTTASAAQMALYPPPFAAGPATPPPPITPPVTSPPPVDTKHKVRSLLEVDGVIVNPNEPVTLV